MWIKIGKDIPFVEFLVADILYNSRIVYQDNWEKGVPDKELEEIREAIKEAKVPGLKVIEKKTHFKELKISEYCIVKTNKQTK